MKNVIVCAALFISLHSFAQAQRTFFRLSDTSFTVGQIYVPAQPMIFLIDSHNYIDMTRNPGLDTIAWFLNRHPGMLIEIGFHSDVRGKDSTNLLLSEWYAKEVKRYLTLRGVSEYSLAAVGYGETRPLIKESEILKVKDKVAQEELAAKNRRVEFRILQVPQPVFRFTDSVFHVGQIMYPVVVHDFSHCGVREESFGFMDSLANWLISHPEIKIEIGHHIEARGSAQSNLKITGCRAKAIASELQKRNVPETQYTVVGYGDTKPIVQENYISAIKSYYGRDELYRINRRVEIRIISIAN